MKRSIFLGFKFVFAVASGIGACGEAVFAQAIVPSGDTANQFALDEIQITATRRSESLQVVPIDVVAVTGEQLNDTGIKKLGDLQFIEPGVYFGTSPNDSGFRLRGVGTAGGFSSSSEQNVGTVIDGVVVPFGNPLSSLGDVARIEVLKGPQGTQFGKNASSGVVSITTTAPDLNAFGGNGYAEYGSLAERDVHGTLNMPLVEGVSGVQLFVFDRYSHGFIDDVVTHQELGGFDDYGAKAKFLWQPSENFSAYFIADFSRSDQAGQQQLWTITHLQPGDPFLGRPFVNLAALGVNVGRYNLNSAEWSAGINDERDVGASLDLEWHLSDYTLTSVSAYRGFITFPEFGSFDATPNPRSGTYDYGQPNSYVSQEIRLTAPKNDVLNYVAGVYASRWDRSLILSAYLNPAVPTSHFYVPLTNGVGDSETDSKSGAAFVDGTAKITDLLNLVAGARVTYDTVTASHFSTPDTLAYPPFNPGPPPSGVLPYETAPYASGSTHKTDGSGRLGLQYTPMHDVMLYATTARGYLGPTVTFSQQLATKTDVLPQTVLDFTVGAKTEFFDHRLRFDVSTFYDRYKDLQTSVYDGIEFVTKNAGGLVSDGLEFQTNFRATESLTFGLSYAYTHAYFTNYIASCPTSIQVQGAATIAAECGLPGSTNPFAPPRPPAQATYLWQAAGQDLPAAPRNTFNLDADYRTPISGTLEADALANYYYRSSTYGEVGNTLSINPGYGIVNTTVGIGARDLKWRVGLFARNLFDKQFPENLQSLPFATPGNTVSLWAAQQGRRVWGVSLNGKF